MIENPYNDGYGDDLPDDEVVERYWRWAHSVTGKLTNPHGPLYDDLVQEALIEIWRILRVKGGKANVSANYLTMGAKHRLLDVAQGKPMFGGDRRPGPRSEPAGSLLSPLEAYPEDADVFEDVDFAQYLDAVALAYHEGEIQQAISSLPPAHRAYVEMRFWGGMTDTEIASLTGATNKALGNSWRRAIKPALSASLDHLASAW